MAVTCTDLSSGYVLDWRYECFLVLSAFHCHIKHFPSSSASSTFPLFFFSSDLVILFCDYLLFFHFSASSCQSCLPRVGWSPFPALLSWTGTWLCDTYFAFSHFPPHPCLQLPFCLDTDHFSPGSLFGIQLILLFWILPEFLRHLTALFTIIECIF